MEALRNTYGPDSNDDGGEGSGGSLPQIGRRRSNDKAAIFLRACIGSELEDSRTSKGIMLCMYAFQSSRSSLVTERISSPPLQRVVIPCTAKKQIELFVKKDQIIIRREFHISLGRSVPIRVHQIDSIPAMLRRTFQFPKCYLIDFGKWDIFVNDDQARSFISLEVLGSGLSEVNRLAR